MSCRGFGCGLLYCRNLGNVDGVACVGPEFERGYLKCSVSSGGLVSSIWPALAPQLQVRVLVLKNQTWQITREKKNGQSPPPQPHRDNEVMVTFFRCRMFCSAVQKNERGM